MIRRLILPIFVCATLYGCSSGGTDPAGTGGHNTDAASDAFDGADGMILDAAESGTDGADGAVDGAPSESPVATHYCNPLANLICSRAASCGCGALLPGGVLDVAACTSRYEDKCLAAYAEVVNAVHVGSARIDSTAAQACIKRVEDVTPGCESPRGSVTLGLCPSWFTSDIPIGQPCSFPVCADGAGHCLDGKCAKRPIEGEPCVGFECSVGLLCLDGFCRAPAAVGEACLGDVMCRPPLRCAEGSCVALGSEGEPCGNDEECALGLRCSGTFCVARGSSPCSETAPCGNLSMCAQRRRCRTRASSGQSCSSHEGCQAGMGCDPASNECTEYPSQGQACQNGISCALGLACNTDSGQCEPLPANGEPCALGEKGPFVCEEGLGCNAGTCGPMPGAGDSCTVDSRCADGLGCDFLSESTCVQPKELGAECQNDSACRAGLHCNYSTSLCAENYGSGVPCKDGNECGSEGTCAPSQSGGFACTRLPGVGEECLWDCETGLGCVTEPAASSCFPEVCLAL